MDAAGVVLIDGILARNGWRGGHGSAELEVSMARRLQAGERNDPLSKKQRRGTCARRWVPPMEIVLQYRKQARQVYDCAIFRAKREILDLHGFERMSDPMSQALAQHLAGFGKRRVCHPEPVSFAGEGSAVRKKAKEKGDSSPVQKPNGV